MKAIFILLITFVMGAAHAEAQNIRNAGKIARTTGEYFRNHNRENTGKTSILLPANASEIPPLSYMKSGIQSISLFPNPAEETTTISFNLREDALVNFQVFNMLGKTMMSEKAMLSKGNNTLTTQVSQLLPGIYFFRIQIGEEQKIIKVNKL